MDAPKIGLYLRLSREDGDCESESQSITNQRDFLQRYTAQRGWGIRGEYIDDGYTGTHFDRPAFQRLLRDIEEKTVDTVITKDLSRLGRDQINTMYFYQVYFPQRQVRYIAVNENMDTGAGNNNDMLDILRRLRRAHDLCAQGASSYMVCQGYRRGVRLGRCTAHSMREDRVVETVRRQLKGLARELDKETLQQAVLRDEGTRISQRQLDAAPRKLEANKKIAQRLCQDKALSMLAEVEFEELFRAAL